MPGTDDFVNVDSNDRLDLVILDADVDARVGVRLMFETEGLHGVAKLEVPLTSGLF